MRAAALFVLLWAAQARAEELKIATLAPNGSAWAKIMEKGNARLQAETQGRVALRYYFSGQQGDERDVVRKMKLGLLDGAALTAVGLGIIEPDVLVLQLPYLFSDDAQVDRVRRELAPVLEKEFDDAGYVLLSWGDVGWAHMYMTDRIQTPDALQKARVWVPTDDPIAREFLGLLGLNAVPLGVGDVLPALQTGSIDVCFGPPLAAIALQWHTKVRSMTDRPATYAIGAFVVRKAAFAKLSPEDQALMRTGSVTMSAELTESVRRDNERALKAMLKKGIVMVHIDDATYAKLVAAAHQVWTRLAGKVYSKEILERVQAVLQR